jgi:hypothetical protein
MKFKKWRNWGTSLKTRNFYLYKSEVVLFKWKFMFNCKRKKKEAQNDVVSYMG